MNKYSKIILLIVLIDTIITVVGIQSGYIVEKAPLTLWFFKKGGVFSLAAGKIVFMTLPGIVILEIVWRKNLICRDRMRLYYRITIAAYCLLYVIGFFAANYLLI